MTSSGTLSGSRATGQRSRIRCFRWSRLAAALVQLPHHAEALHAQPGWHTGPEHQGDVPLDKWDAQGQKSNRPD